MIEGTVDVAGAIVLRDVGGKLKIALAREPRKGPSVWVLPKGHSEPGESLEETALREVREEVGLTNIQLIKYLGRIVRPSVEEAGKVVKKTIHIYLAYALGDEQFQSPLDPLLVEVNWFSPQKALEMIPFEEDRNFLKEHLPLMFD